MLQILVAPELVSYRVECKTIACVSGSKFTLRIGAIAVAIIWYIRTFITTAFQIFVVDSFFGMAQTAQSLSLNALTYDKANKTNLLKYTMYREMAINFGGVILFATLIYMTKLTTAFKIASIGALLTSLF